MKERPIIFSGPMVRAILEGRKTQTRRVVHSPDPCCYDPRPIRKDFEERMRLWVRETLSVVANWGSIHYVADDVLLYDPDFQKVGFPYCVEAEAIVERYGDSYHANDLKCVPSIFMPRWASRITLEIAKVRIERIQDISEEDAIAEGCGLCDNGLECECGWLGWEDSPGVKRVDEGEEGEWDFLCPRCGERTSHHPIDEQARMEFRKLWDSINAKRGFGWQQNPWVWAISFKRIGG